MSKETRRRWRWRSEPIGFYVCLFVCFILGIRLNCDETLLTCESNLLLESFYCKCSVSKSQTYNRRHKVRQTLINEVDLFRVGIRLVVLCPKTKPKNKRFLTIFCYFSNRQLTMFQNERSFGMKNCDKSSLYL